MVHIGNDWDERLAGEFEKEYYLALRQFLIEEYRRYQVYPDMYDIFNALKYTSFADTKVVILGQDPYHGPGQAHGLCFSVKKGVEPPPSLQNIFKELMEDVGIPQPPHGELTCWAREGVLLLNTVLTVRAHQPNSHKGKGWEILTDRIISELNHKTTPVVFLLWGGQCPEQKEAYHQPSACYTGNGASQPLVRIRRLFRLQAFFSGEPGAGAKRTGTHRLDGALNTRRNHAYNDLA